MGKPRLSIIAAMAKNRVIGIHNTLPWRLPEDLKHFKALTLGHHILMGRKTWESLPGKLPGRTSVVITRSGDLQVPGCVVANSIEEAIAACGSDDEIFFIGGAEVYRQTLNIADRIYLTEIQAEFKGDAWFPEFDTNLWRETGRRPCKSENGLEYDFLIYDRKSSAPQG
jgi:dihydrofolate reductase